MSEGASDPETWTREERAAYRAFVRDHHPDRGGDPEAFVEGLARLRAGRAAPAPGSGDAPREHQPVVFGPGLPRGRRVGG
ncbi:hypothetical protein AB0B41_41195, partial [Pseudonocardia sp. NPDC049154]